MTSTWNGYVVGVPTENSFWAIMKDGMGVDLSVEFPIDSLKPADQVLIDEGSFIKWTVSFGTSTVQLECEAWSQEEIDAIEEKAKDLYDDIFQ